MSKAIPLTQGRVTIVDDADFEWLNYHKWYAHRGRSTWYAARKTRGKFLYMHRLILNTPPGLQTDHIGRDGLDNRRCNLRICSGSQHQATREKRTGYTSRYKGVSKSRGEQKWSAFIHVQYKTRYLGRFTKERDAARAYNDAARKFFGDFACLNIIGGD